MKHFYFTLLTIFFFATANAQIVNIPDANFKAKLIALGKDTNADGQIQVTSLSGYRSLCESGFYFEYDMD